MMVSDRNLLFQVSIYFWDLQPTYLGIITHLLSTISVLFLGDWHCWGWYPQDSHDTWGFQTDRELRFPGAAQFSMRLGGTSAGDLLGGCRWMCDEVVKPLGLQCVLLGGI